MKKLYNKIELICALLLIGISANAQSPSWLWAKKAGGASNDVGKSVSADVNGNVYVTGYYNSPTITFGASTFTNGGSFIEDVFIAKYDALGNVLWAKSAGGTGTDQGTSINTDASGNVYVTGYFQSTSITFGATTLTTVPFSSNMFVLKYDGSGNLIWAKCASGANNIRGRSINSDASGNVYVTGDYGSSTVTIGSTTLSSSGILDVFTVKYDALGNVLWAKSAGGTNNDYSMGISTDASSNVFVTGYFFSSAMTCSTTVLTNANGGSCDVFAIKYDALGNFIWAKRAGGLGSDFGNGISADAAGNSYLTGKFDSPTLALGTTTLTNAGNTDFFLYKYDPSGNIVWARGIAGTGYEVGNSVATPTNGNVYIAGQFTSNTITCGTTTLTNAIAGTDDIFVLKYDVSGNALWAKSVGASGNQIGYGVSPDINGNVFVTGSIGSNPVSFGPTTLTSAGMDDIFVAKLDNVITGITNENYSITEFNIYPNPSNGLLEIVINENAISFLKITNTLGQIVFYQELISQKETINLQSLESGVYNLSLTSEDKIIVNKKLIIQK